MDISQNGLDHLAAYIGMADLVTYPYIGVMAPNHRK